MRLPERYVFVRQLGEGGMGRVVLATDRVLNRPVAIKLLHDDYLANSESQTILLREARFLARLSHPNLVAVHDVLTLDGRVAMVLEYVDGIGLDVLIDSGEMRYPAGGAAALQLVDVLAFLHDKGVVHRDIKPSNAVIRSDGTLKLIDFGLARHHSGLADRITRVRGTPAYMSPEQRHGASITVTSDVYSLGVTLFELFCGELPFLPNVNIMAQLLGPPPRLAERIPVPAALDDLVAHCLQTEASDRPADASVVHDRLSAIARAERWPGSYERAHLGYHSGNLDCVDEFPAEVAHASMEAVAVAWLESGELPADRATVHDITADAPPPAAANALTVEPLLPSAPVVLEAIAAPEQALAESPLPQPSARRPSGLVAAVVALVVVGGGIAAYAFLGPTPSTSSTRADPAAEAPLQPRADESVGPPPEKVVRTEPVAAPKVVEAAVEEPSPVVVRPVPEPPAAGLVLLLDSEPSGARVLEGEVLLGATPLRVALDRETLARSPRELTLAKEGYLTHKHVQGAVDDGAVELNVSVTLKKARRTRRAESGGKPPHPQLDIRPQR